MRQDALGKVPARILVVDDERTNRDLLKAALATGGYEAIVVSGGAEALKMAEGTDLFILDAMMPDMDGFEVLAHLRKGPAGHLVPILMCTALNDSASRARAFELGADEFISKPFDRLELLARVRSLLNVKSFHDQQIRYQHDLELEVARITSQLREAYQEAKDAVLDTLFRLSQAAEIRDGFTGSHIIRVGRFCVAMGRGMGLLESTVESLLLGSPMHDVGKIGIPDSILLKPGKLTEEEFTVMKRHCEIGSDLLSRGKSRILRVGEAIALTHHEWWNGKGYPRGLKGEEIPLEGRICAVADVFDALTSHRPYRGPLPVEDAFSIIEDGAGRQFDPEVTKAFFSNREGIMAIKADLDSKAGFSRAGNAPES